MRNVQILQGKTVPLDIADVDTDQIIPAVWMKRIFRDGFEKGLFQQWRRNPDFILNQQERKGANILISGPNFGCGSSSEHAPWALRDHGFKAIIATSFGDIFRMNLANVGLVPVLLGAGEHERLMTITKSDAGAIVQVDLSKLTVTCDAYDYEETFAIDSTARYQLLNGLDPIDLILEHETIITNYEARRAWWMPAGNREVESPFEESGVAEKW